MSKLINWAEASKILSGNIHSVRENKVPKIYKKKIDILIDLVEKWEKFVQEEKNGVHDRWEKIKKNN